MELDPIITNLAKKSEPNRPRYNLKEDEVPEEIAEKSRKMLSFGAGSVIVLFGEK